MLGQSTGQPIVGQLNGRAAGWLVGCPLGWVIILPAVCVVVLEFKVGNSCLQEFIFWNQKNVPDRNPEDIFFSCVFRRNFSQERVFGEVAGIPVFFPFLQEFFTGIPVGQEFLYLPLIPPDSSGFLFPPNLWHD